ncbi:MAG: hypothetical protein RL685_5915 [Pseudomonadota bacterium]|jgi:hypothetical protein
MTRKTLRWTFASGVTLALLGSTVLAGAVGTRRFELHRGKDFQGGDLKGVAIDSAGQVHAGLNLGAVPLGEAQSVWSALPRPDGTLLLGTGNEGKLLEVRNGAVRVAAETKALVITSMVEGWKGDVLLGSMPKGEVLRWSGGKLSTLAKLEGVEHIWSLAFDKSTQALFAATGPDGKLFRIDQSGKAQVYFDAEEQHLLSVAVSATRTGSVVYAGASDKAKLYEVRAPGRANVLYDFARTEVRSIVVGARGEVYAIANDIKSGGLTASRDDDGGDGPQSPPPKTTGKGVLYRFATDGTPEALLEDSDEHYTSLALDPKGQPYVGTGVNGRIYTVDEAHNDVLVADTEERQVSVLLFGGNQQFATSSDPAVLHPVRGIGGTDAVWTSKALDAGLRAHFGQLSWTSSGPLELSTRTGNTQQPDDTWSPWSEPLLKPGMTQSPVARYVQIRARWSRDPQAALREVTLPFVTDNLRAVLTSLEVDREKDDRVSNGRDDIGSSGGPVSAEADPVVKLKWKVDNPDSDELRYRLQYRLLGTNEWVELLKAGRPLTKSQYDWDTADLPEGRYQVKVLASDELSNPPDRVKRHDLTSATIVVDNTPPALVALEANGRRVTGTATDGVGPIARIEMGIAGSGEWYPFYPRDGIYDQQREDFDVDVSTFSQAGRVVIAVRVYDQANNFIVRHVTLP